MFFLIFFQAMVGTGEALLHVRAKGAPASQGVGVKGPDGIPATGEDFDFQGELLKFDKV